MIKIDIPMPSCCLLCPMSSTDNESPFFDAYCNLLKRYIEENDARKVQDDCPIEEVERVTVPVVVDTERIAERVVEMLGNRRDIRCD